MTTADVPSFTCPCCGATSYSRADIVHGYCGRCHTYTGTCAYFLMCPNRAEGYTAHPDLGRVPTCSSCAAKVGVELLTP